MKLVLLVSMFVIISCTSKVNNQDIIDVKSVNIEGGQISGITGQDGIIKIFKGIPFAAPPTGNLRWKAPAPVEPWKGIRKCETFSPSAMQSKPAPYQMWSMEFQPPEGPLSEDCLYLNVWTKANRDDEKLPVIMWIHGGAFTGGSGSVPLYDGEEMAKKGVVFVTINYRVGVFGFLAHPELSNESIEKVSGNYGILDQIMALKWVKNNIASFGGDTGNITIAGQSAGAYSVNILMTSPKAKGLFHRAIAHSGGMFQPNISRFNSLQNAEINGKRFSENLKVKSIEQLRSLPADELMKAGGNFNVIIDSCIVFPAYESFVLSKQNDVPLLTGWNADEFYFGQPLKANDYKKEIKASYGEISDEFLKAFPGNSDEEAAKSQKLFSCLSFGWQNYFWALMQSKYGKNQSFLYYFTHVPPGLPNYGAFHSAEFGYVFRTLKYWNRPFEQGDYELSEIMSSYWINFAKNGNPNGEGLAEWPAFDPLKMQVMEFGDKVYSHDLPLKEQISILDQLDELARNYNSAK